MNQPVRTESRRTFLKGMASSGALLMAGCAPAEPPTYGHLLRMGDLLTYKAHRLLLPASALAREYELHDITPVMAVGSVNPGDPVLRSGLGGALGRLGRWDEAADQYRQAVLMAPGSLAARTNLAVALVQAGRWDEAVREARAGLAVQATYAPLWITLGAAFQGRGQPAEAVPALRRALPGTGLENWYDLAFDPEGVFDGKPSLFVSSLSDSDPAKNVIYRIGPDGSFLGLFIRFGVDPATSLLPIQPSAGPPA